MDWVRARQSALLKVQQQEGAALIDMAEWTLAATTSRPASATEKAEEV